MSLLQLCVNEEPENLLCLMTISLYFNYHHSYFVQINILSMLLIKTNMTEHFAYVSEESKAVKEATESMEELSVETNSEVTSSDAATETSNPTSIPAADI